MESELARRGAFLRSRSDALADQLLADRSASGATHLLLLGDVKHRFTHTSPQEGRDVPRFFTKLAESFESILITPGNHDTGLARLLPRAEHPRVIIGDPRGEVLGGPGTRIGALHGHTLPRRELLAASSWLVGHTHAAAAIVDQAGQATTEWAWFRGRLDPERSRAEFDRRIDPLVIVFPPYNPLCGGTPINRDGILGPLGRLADASRSALWLLDGRQAVDLAGIPLASRRRMGAPD